MDRFPTFDEDYFKDILIGRDPSLWIQMEQSNLYAHMRVLRGDGNSLSGGQSLAEMWFEWWLEHDAEMSPLLENAQPADGTLSSMLSERYATGFDIFGVGEYSFLSEVKKKVPEWMSMHAAWKVRPDAEQLAGTGTHAARIALMLADGFTFDEAVVWARGSGRFAPSNPSEQVHRYRALTRLGVEPSESIDLLVEHPKRPVWQVMLLREGMPLDYVEAL